ncbi:MAG: PKD domain-containing protein, partial [Chitinophagaceae bacterium]|nr:PKD domain-containing protein [Chitinophagaceae bacterium]
MRQRLFHIFLRQAIVLSCIIPVTQLNGQAPVANFSGTPQSGCSPLVVNFQDLSSNNPTSWLWNFGNGNTSTLQNPTATYFNPGTYTVSLTATNAIGSNTSTRTQYITVYEPPTVNFVGDNLSGCFPLRVQFTDLSTAGSGNTNTSWLWDFGDGTTSTQQNPLITYTSAGNYSVTLRVTNDKGCTKIFTRSNYITVTNGVTASFTHSLPTVCNSPASISFTNTTTGPATLSYQWNFGDGTPLSTLQNPTHTYTSNGSYIVTLVATSTAGCQDTAFSSPIIIGGYTTSFNAPASICINELITFTNTSVPTPLNSNWNFGDGGTATTINTTHTFINTGNYTVWLHNNYNGCQDSISQVITVNPRPAADFTAPDSSRCEPPFTVNFQDLSSPGTVGWEWDFGDGSPVSNQQNPSHTYNSYGTFTITLIATNNFGCTDTIIKPDFITV